MQDTIHSALHDLIVRVQTSYQEMVKLAREAAALSKTKKNLEDQAKDSLTPAVYAPSIAAMGEALAILNGERHSKEQEHAKRLSSFLSAWTGSDNRKRLVALDEDPELMVEIVIESIVPCKSPASNSVGALMLGAEVASGGFWLDLRLNGGMLVFYRMPEEPFDSENTEMF